MIREAEAFRQDFSPESSLTAFTDVKEKLRDQPFIIMYQNHKKRKKAVHEPIHSVCAGKEGVRPESK